MAFALVAECLQYLIPAFAFCPAVDVALGGVETFSDFFGVACEGLQAVPVIQFLSGL